MNDKLIPLVAFDIDDVIFESFDVFKDKGEELYGVTIDYPKNFGLIAVSETGEVLSKEVWYDIIDKAIFDYDKFEPMNGALTFVHNYQRLSNNVIHFVTSRNAERSNAIKEATEALILKWFSKYNYKIHYSRNLVNPKVKIVNEIGAEYFVEDCFKYVEELTSSGIKVFMPLKSWNSEFPYHTNSNIIPINKWKDIYKYFSNVLGVM